MTNNTCILLDNLFHFVKNKKIIKRKPEGGKNPHAAAVQTPMHRVAKVCSNTDAELDWDAISA